MGYWVGGMVQGQGSIDLREILGHFAVISKMGFSGLGPEKAGRDLHGFAVPGARNGEFLGVEAIQQAVPVLECYQLEKLNLTALPSRPKP